MVQLDWWSVAGAVCCMVLLVVGSAVFTGEKTAPLTVAEVAPWDDAVRGQPVDDLTEEGASYIDEVTEWPSRRGYSNRSGSVRANLPGVDAAASSSVSFQGAELRIAYGGGKVVVVNNSADPANVGSGDGATITVRDADDTGSVVTRTHLSHGGGARVAAGPVIYQGNLFIALLEDANPLSPQDLDLVKYDLSDLTTEEASKDLGPGGYDVKDMVAHDGRIYVAYEYDSTVFWVRTYDTSFSSGANVEVNTPGSSVAVSDEGVYLVQNGNKLERYSLDLSSRTGNADLGGAASAGPSIEDGFVFVPWEDGANSKVARFDMGLSSKTQKGLFSGLSDLAVAPSSDTVFVTSDSEVHAIDYTPSDFSTITSKDPGSDSYGSPVATQDVVLVPDTGGAIHQLAHDTSVQTSTSFNGEVEDMAIAPGILFAATDDMKLHSIGSDPSPPKRPQKLQPANETQVDTPSSVFLSGVFEDGEASQGTLYFYNATDDVLIGSCTASVGERCGVSWERDPGTTSGWYAAASDGTHLNVSKYMEVSTGYNSTNLSHAWNQFQQNMTRTGVSEGPVPGSIGPLAGWYEIAESTGRIQSQAVAGMVETVDQGAGESPFEPFIVVSDGLNVYADTIRSFGTDSPKRVFPAEDSVKAGRMDTTPMIDGNTVYILNSTDEFGGDSWLHKIPFNGTHLLDRSADGKDEVVLSGSSEGVVSTMAMDDDYIYYTDLKPAIHKYGKNNLNEIAVSESGMYSGGFHSELVVNGSRIYMTNESGLVMLERSGNDVDSDGVNELGVLDSWNGMTGSSPDSVPVVKGKSVYLYNETNVVRMEVNGDTLSDVVAMSPALTNTNPNDANGGTDFDFKSPAPAVTEDAVFVGDDGKLVRLDADDLSEENRFKPSDLGVGPSEDFVHTPVVAGDYVFAAFGDFVVQLTRDDLNVESEHVSGDEVNSPPSVIGGRLFVGNDNTNISMFGGNSSFDSITLLNPDDEADAPSANLEATASHPDDIKGTMKFFNASDDDLIGECKQKDDGSCSVTWGGLESGEAYSWYAVVSDGMFQKQSKVSTFKTGNEPPDLEYQGPGDDAFINNDDRKVELKVRVKNREDGETVKVALWNDTLGEEKYIESWEFPSDGSWQSRTKNIGPIPEGVEQTWFANVTDFVSDNPKIELTPRTFTIRIPPEISCNDFKGECHKYQRKFDYGEDVNFSAEIVEDSGYTMYACSQDPGGGTCPSGAVLCSVGNAGSCNATVDSSWDKVQDYWIAVEDEHGFSSSVEGGYVVVNHPQLSIDGDADVTVSLQSEDFVTFVVSNSANRPRDFRLEAAPSNNPSSQKGVIAVKLSEGSQESVDRYGVRSEFTIPAKGTQTVIATFNGALCSKSTCQQDVGFKLTNLDTGETNEETVTVRIKPQDRSVAAPGIGILQLVFLAVGAASLVLLKG